MLLSTLLATLGRRTGLGLLWRATALGLALVALVLAWLVRPRADGPADALLAAGLTTVAALLAASALAGRGVGANPAPVSARRDPSEAERPWRGQARARQARARQAWTLRTVVAARAA